jgi:uncharacterized protein (TIGR00369 family)
MTEPLPARHEDPPVQVRYAPDGVCFGCGPANAGGLHLESREMGTTLVAAWQPRRVHEAFAGYVNGGIIGTLIDCHGNWAAALALMRRLGLDGPAPTVTAELSVRYRRPTPSGEPLILRAQVTEIDDRSATAEVSVEADGAECATGIARYVAVGPGHPAHERW